MYILYDIRGFLLGVTINLRCNSSAYKDRQPQSFGFYFNITYNKCGFTIPLMSKVENPNTIPLTHLRNVMWLNCIYIALNFDISMPRNL